MKIRANPWPLEVVLALAVALFAGVRVWAQTTASSKPRNKPSIAALLSPGAISEGVYHNSVFAFSYKIPFGWVDRTAEMREPDTNQVATDPAKAQVLLGVFERPPEATGNTINATVVIAAESISSYAGLKAAVDYFDPLEEVITARGFKVVNQPYEFPVGAKQLAREDFSKERGKLTMQQATIVMLAKGYVVSFTFIAGSEEDVDELVQGLNFAVAPRSAATHSQPAAPPTKK